MIQGCKRAPQLRNKQEMVFRTVLFFFRYKTQAKCFHFALEL